MSDVAVVVPCCDLGRTVRESVESVRAQTRPAGELVVVDDGSTDLHTRQELERLRREGVAVVRTENHGVAAARNLGVRLTSAPYLVLLDADDLLVPDYLEKLAGRLDERPELDFVTCEIQAFGAASFRWTPPACTLVDTLARGGQHVSTMFRRRLWERVGGFDESLAGYEDYDFWISALAAGMTGDVVREPLLRYRIRAGSRYHRAIAAESYAATMRAIYERHRASVERYASEILVAKDRFLQEQRAYRDDRERRRFELEQRLAGVEEQIRAARAELAARGVPSVSWGDLDGVEPLSRNWGLDRGRPLDRHYVEAFLGRHRGDVRGRVLEVKDAGYTRMFGDGRVSRSEVLDNDPTHPEATLIADLATGDGIPEGAYDCFICTQTVHLNFDFRAVLASAVRLLAPGGTLLCTLPAVSRIDYERRGLDGGDFWRFTEAAVRELFAELLAPEQVELTVFGNVKTAAGFLYGVVPEELSAAELDHVDPFFPVLYGVRAVKPAAAGGASDGRPAGEALRRRALAGEAPAGTVLLYHRVADLDPDPHALSVPPAEFRDQMRLLGARCRPMPLADLVRGALAGDLPAGAVAVTFDDGTLDNLTTASPILLAEGIPATFFVLPGEIDGRREHLWDTLARIFLGGAALPERLELPELPGGVVPTRTAAERLEAHRWVNELLFPRGAEEREDLLGRVAAWSGVDLAPRDSHRALLAAELRDLAAREGHAIGAHTLHHLALPFQGPETLRREVAGSREALERLLGRPVTAFAYPYGATSRGAIDAVAAAGFELAVTVEARAVRTGVLPLLVPRLEVRRGSLDAFAKLLDTPASRTA